MKFKMFAFIGLVSVSSFVAAQSVTVGYASKELDAGGYSHQNSLSVKAKLMNNISGDIGFSGDSKDATNAITNRYELGLTYSTPLLFGMNGDLRVSHGWKAKSGSDVTTYYAFEPSVTARVGNTPLSVKAGYRWRNAWDNAVADDSQTTRLAVSYDLSKKDKISLGRDWSRGDGANTQSTLQYSRSF